MRLRPRPTLLLSGMLILVAVPLPLSTTFLTLGTRVGTWSVAIVGEVACLLLAAIALYLFKTTYVMVTDTDLIERGFFHTTVRTPLSEVHSTVLAQTYSGSTSDTLPQLIVRNERGERILRMRGVFWTEENMRRAAAAIGRQLEEPVEPLSPQQFFEHFPGSAYWWENRRSLALVMIGVIAVLLIGIVLGIMRLLALPILG